MTGKPDARVILMSYSPADSDTAWQIRDSLAIRGFICLMLEADLVPGTDWKSELNTILEAVQGIVILAGAAPTPFETAIIEVDFLLEWTRANPTVAVVAIQIKGPLGDNLPRSLRSLHPLDLRTATSFTRHGGTIAAKLVKGRNAKNDTKVALNLRRAGRIDEAITLQKQILERMERRGRDRPGILAAKASLAASLWQAGELETAISIEEEVLALRTAAFGAEHPDTLTTGANLGVSYSSLGDSERGIQLQESVLSLRTETLGSYHPDTLTSVANLAAAYHRVGQTDRAISLLERSMPDWEVVLGEHHPDTETVRLNLASFYLAAGRSQEAKAIARQLLIDKETVQGVDHPLTRRLRRFCQDCGF